MTKTPVLIIMAAGMGSRYGGLKQMESVDEQGQLIIDYSVYDAVSAGFKKVIFVIKPEMREDMDAVIGRRVSPHIEVAYAYQTLDALPEGFAVPAGRKKPWGTAHAVLCALAQVDGPFAAINADDFYGRNSYSEIYSYLTGGYGDNAHAMVGYRLKNTLTDFGHVSRGVCAVNEYGFLTDIRERVHIERRGEDAAYTEDGESFVPLDGECIVSMNMWGFGAAMKEEILGFFPEFLKTDAAARPDTAEYLLPDVPRKVIENGRGTVRVLPCEDKWFGVTYREDKASLTSAIERMKQEGVYPRRLWEQHL